MSKNKTPVKKTASTGRVKISTALPWYQNPLYAAIALGITAFVFYFNSRHNDYALDDIISITGNSFTKNGFAGIPGILFKDSFYGFIGNPSELSGGRWRPLALISFAIEWQFFHKSPHISHYINIMLYVGIAILLFQFLFKFIFKDNVGASFLATFLFVIHPVHTEVVANIKSRDELLSLFFLLCTCIFSLNYYYGKKGVVNLVLSFVFYFMALLSKENGLTFIAILPILFYVISKDSSDKVFMKALPFIGIAVFYMALRFAILKFKHGEITEVMNAPYLYATGVEAIATKIYIMLLYVKLLIYPYPLSYDYSYNQIPYVNFSNPWVIISMLLYGSLVFYSLKNIGRRDILCFGILFYLLSIFIVSNLLVDVGGTMGERFLFQPSVGFVIGITALLMKVSERFPLPQKRMVAAPIMGVLLVLAFNETRVRNKDWKDEKVLFVKDVITCPNSARTNNGAGTAFIFLSDEAKDSLQKKAFLDSAILHLRTALKIHPKYIDPWLNLGVVYNRTGDIDKAEEMWNHAREKDPHHPKLGEFDKILATTFLNNSMKAAAKGDYANAAVMADKSRKYGPANTQAWMLAGTLFEMAGNKERSSMVFDSARHQFSVLNDEKEFDRNRSEQYLKMGLTAGSQKLFRSSISLFKKAIQFNSNNDEAWYNIGGAYFTIQKPDSAYYAWSECLRINPGHVQARLGMNAITSHQKK